MPKGLIPLLGGLGVAGTMVGISMPSAVTVIPKKNETHSYTGFVFNNKIYKEKSEIAPLLATELNNQGSNFEDAKTGIFKYTISGIAANTSIMSEAQPANMAEANLKNTIASKYSWSSAKTTIVGEVSTILSIQKAQSVFPAFTTFSDFKYSLQPLDEHPKDSIANIDILGYTNRSTTLSGGRILSKGNGKYYWYKDIKSALPAATIKTDAGGQEYIDESMDGHSLVWGEAPNPNQPGGADVLRALKFIVHGKPSQPTIYIHSSLDYTTIENASFTSGGNTYSGTDLLLIASVSGTGDRGGTAGSTRTKFDLIETATNKIVGEIINADGVTTPPSVLTSSSIIKDATSVDPVAAKPWDANNVMLNEIDKHIHKVTTNTNFTSGQGWPITSSTTHSPYLYSEEVLND